MHLLLHAMLRRCVAQIADVNSRSSQAPLLDLEAESLEQALVGQSMSQYQQLSQALVVVLLATQLEPVPQVQVLEFPQLAEELVPDYFLQFAL